VWLPSDGAAVADRRIEMISWGRAPRGGQASGGRSAVVASRGAPDESREAKGTEQHRKVGVGGRLTTVQNIFMSALRRSQGDLRGSVRSAGDRPVSRIPLRPSRTGPVLDMR